MLTDTTDLKVCYLHVVLWNFWILNVFKTSNLGFAVLGPEEKLSRLVHLDEFIALPLVVAKFATNVMCTCGFLVCCSFMMWTWIDCWPDVIIMTDHRTKPFRQCNDLATTITFYNLTCCRWICCCQHWPLIQTWCRLDVHTGWSVNFGRWHNWVQMPLTMHQRRACQVLFFWRYIKHARARIGEVVKYESALQLL